MALCEYCEKELKPGAKFCEHCGSAVTPGAEPAAETQQTTQHGSYQSTIPPAQGSYQQQPQVNYNPEQKQKKPAGNKLLMFGSIGIAVVIIIAAVAIFGGGGKDKGKKSDPVNTVDSNSSDSSHISGLAEIYEESAQAKWNGTWYGYFWIKEIHGEDWSAYGDYFTDAYLVMDVDEDGSGALEIVYVEDGCLNVQGADC